MAYNKVVYGGDTLIDLTGDTVTAADMLSGKKAHDKSGESITGSMTNRGAISQTISPGGSYTIPAGYHNGSGVVSASNVSLQSKTTNVTPSANWSGTNTNTASITPDSGYAGMSQVNVSVPMLRDYTLFTASQTETPGTVYNGNNAQSNSAKMIRIAPTKDGMCYTNSYLSIKVSDVASVAGLEDVDSVLNTYF